MILMEDLKNSVGIIDSILRDNGLGEITLEHLKNDYDGRKYKIRVYTYCNKKDDRAGVDTRWKCFRTRKEVNAFLHGFYDYRRLFNK